MNEQLLSASVNLRFSLSRLRFAKLHLLLIACLVLCALNAARAQTDMNVSGNLQVSGTSDFLNNTLTFGSLTGSGSTQPGLVLSFVDASGTNPALIQFSSGRTAQQWLWTQLSSGSAALPMMKLDENNQVIIYTSGTGGTAGITLNPAGMSTFAGSVTIGGTDNELPNQALVSGSSILTEGLGDARYLALSASSSFVSGSNLIITTGTGIYGESTQAYGLVGGNATGPGSLATASATASGTYSIAVGDNSSATSLRATAIGFEATASGIDSNAYGEWTVASAQGASAFGVGSTASAFASTAFGNFSTASGWSSNSLGEGSVAEGGWSTALGNGSDASGDYSSALGLDSISSGGNATAVGANSAASGDNSNAGGAYSTASGWSSNAPGYFSTANGFAAAATGPWSTASGNYSTAAGSCTNATGYGQFVVGQWNTTQGNASSWVATDNLFIVGNGIGSGTTSNAFVVNKNGDTAVTGALTVSGTSGNLNTIANGGLALTGTAVGVVVGSGTVTTVVSTGSNNQSLVPQQGDLLMGVFVSGPQPPH